MGNQIRNLKNLWKIETIKLGHYQIIKIYSHKDKKKHKNQYLTHF